MNFTDMAGEAKLICVTSIDDDGALKSAGGKGTFHLLLSILIYLIAAIVLSGQSAFAEDSELRMQIGMELYATCLPGCLTETSSNHPRAGQDQRSTYCGLVCGCMSASFLGQASDEEMLIMRQRQSPTSAMQSRVRQVSASCRQAARDGIRLPGK